jgi:hypothetical protein
VSVAIAPASFPKAGVGAIVIIAFFLLFRSPVFYSEYVARSLSATFALAISLKIVFSGGFRPNKRLAVCIETAKKLSTVLTVGD